jgi:prepilin-type processing-associated H-X9-DG protein
MSEIENHIQGKKPKVSKLAVASPLVVVLGLFIGLALAGWLKSNRICAVVGFWIYILSLPVGLVVGIIADHRIYKSKGLLTGRIFSILGTGLALILIVGMLIPPRHPRREYAYQVICRAKLKALGTAMQTYASNHNNQYPTGDKWCDLLIEYTEVAPKHFVCPTSGTKEDQSNYVMNENVAGRKVSDLPDDVVLLFEGKPGWNQVGGPERLTTENHKGMGCNILYMDGHVEFMKTKQFKELKWGVE